MPGKSNPTGCDALAAYLKSAETRLTGDPDRDEILADLEQAIADKLSHHVGAHKNVVTAEEITLALKEMGPVESGAADPNAAGRDRAPPPARRVVRRRATRHRAAGQRGAATCSGFVRAACSAASAMAWRPTSGSM